MDQSRISTHQTGESYTSGMDLNSPNDQEMKTFSLRLWIAWAAQSFMFVLLILAVMWMIISIYAYFKRIQPHEKVELNDADCGLAKNNSPILKGRIVSGQRAGEAFPWTVLIVSKGLNERQRYGTGSLVTPFHVLSAAHLVPNPNDIRELTVMYGSHVVKLMKTTRAVAVRYHTEVFKPNRLSNDIMLLLLETGLNSVPRICVPPAKTSGFLVEIGPTPNVGDTLVIAGFGIQGESLPTKGDGPMPRQLMYTMERVLSSNYCLKHLPYMLVDREFCAKTKATGICRGDSGSSAMLNVNNRFVSVGITSSTKFCGHSPDRFIKVDAYTEWLHSSIDNSPDDFLQLY